MGIIIGKEFTKYDKDVEIETIGGRELISSQDIIGIDGTRFSDALIPIEKMFELQNELYTAYKKQELENKLHYEVFVDVLIVKEFLYEHFIQAYGIIDHIVSASIYENDINVKWKIDDKERSYTFEGIGYELLKKVKIESLKK